MFYIFLSSCQSILPRPTFSVVFDKHKENDANIPSSKTDYFHLQLNLSPYKSLANDEKFTKSVEVELESMIKRGVQQLDPIPVESTALTLPFQSSSLREGQRLHTSCGVCTPRNTCSSIFRRLINANESRTSSKRFRSATRSSGLGLRSQDPASGLLSGL